MAYRFNGSSDYVRFAAAPLSGYSMGPVTMAALFKRASSGTADIIVHLIDTGLTGYRGMLKAGSGTLSFTHAFSASTAFGVTVDDTSKWYIAASTWAGSGTTPRLHRHDGTSWGHENGNSSLSGAASVGGTDLLAVSSSLGFDWFHGDIVCVGIKKSDRTDGQIETLSPTSFQAWRDFGFDWLIGFDSSLEVAGILQDQASPGTGDEVAISGTSLVSDPAGWAWVSMTAPVANFTATPLTGTRPLAVNFTDTSA